MNSAPELCRRVAEACADCGGPIGDDGPPDGWQLEDGRTICHACCAADLRRFASELADA